MRGRARKPNTQVKEAAAKIKKTTKKPLETEAEVSYNRIISTGSTLLDLAITGDKVKGGGIPAGIIIEISGPSSTGKTSILGEMSSSVIERGGSVRFLDPEARLDRDYTEIYGFSLKDDDYHRPDTVNQMFKHIWDWKPEKPEEINMVAADSLAALSTEMEMEDEDKMGMKRAKDFSQGLRKSCRIIADRNIILACSNQEREGGNGLVTPGGRGIPYYASLRIRIKPNFKEPKIKRTKKIGTKTVEKIVGIRSECEVKKSSIGSPFRTAPISIIFNYGIDTIRDELMWFRDLSGAKEYDAINKSFATIQKAIDYIEANSLEKELKKRTIKTWEEIQEKFRTDRKRKNRK